MKQLRFAVLFLMLGAFLSTTATAAITVGQIDTFEGSIENWFAGGLGSAQVPPEPPKVIADGGPNGVGDGYLLVSSFGGQGPGSKLVVMNNKQWVGNYAAAGVTQISMDLSNFGSTDLTIRLLFENPQLGPPADEAVTTTGFFLPAGSGWMHADFLVDADDLTALFGSASNVLSNTTLLRIIHSPIPSEAVAVAATLGVDNISAVPLPAAFWLMLTGMLGFIKGRRV